jgi:hypothetical protein
MKNKEDMNGLNPLNIKKSYLHFIEIYLAANSLSQITKCIKTHEVYIYHIQEGVGHGGLSKDLTRNTL